MKSAVAYLRVSGKGQVSGTGFDRQDESVRTFAKKSGHNIEEVYQETFTGTDAERPEFVRMLEDLLSNGCRTIIIESLDRLARDLSVQLQLVALLISRGVTLYSANTGQDITAAMKSDPMHKAMIQMQGVFAELDKSLIVRKLRKARESIRASQGRCEGRKPYGYYDGEDRVIERIRALYRKPRGSDRLSYYAIAKQLNEEGFRTRKDTNWTGEQVKRILSR